MGSRLFREQEIAGSTPAAPTGASSNGRAAVLQTADGGSIPSAPTRDARFIPQSKVVSRPLKPVRLVRFQLGEQSTCGGRCVLACMPRCERGGAGSIPAGHPDLTSESADEWSSTGPENRGGGDEPQRFDSSALVAIPCGAVRLTARLPLFQPGNGGFDTPQRHARPRSARSARGRCPLKAETRVQIPHATLRPRQVDRGQDYECRLGGSNPSGGQRRAHLETCWSGNRPVR